MDNKYYIELMELKNNIKVKNRKYYIKRKIKELNAELEYLEFNKSIYKNDLETNKEEPIKSKEEKSKEELNKSKSKEDKHLEESKEELNKSKSKEELNKSKSKEDKH